MSLKDKLYNSISNYTSIDQLYAIGAKHDKGHKQATIDRELRHLVEDKKIIVIKNKRGVNIGYMRIYDAILRKELEKPTTEQIEPNKTIIKPKSYCEYWENNACRLKKKCNNCLLNK